MARLYKHRASFWYKSQKSGFSEHFRLTKEKELWYHSFIGAVIGLPFYCIWGGLTMNQIDWLQKYGKTLEGKTVAVTGATGGLGKEICRGILFLKGNLLLLNRSQKKTEALCADLLKEYPEGNIQFLPLDLADLASVDDVCQKLTVSPPDILLHNAGIYDVPRVPCSTGLLNVFQVNFAAPYYMTKQLLPALEIHGAKVVVVGSIAHNYSETDPEDPDFSTRKQSPLVYGNSKRYLMFAFSKLLKDNPHVDFSIGHPGITLTNISNHYPSWLYPLIRPFLKVFFMNPERASRGILYGVCRKMENLSWAGPRLFNIWGSPSVKKLTTCSCLEQQHIFESAEKIYQQMLSSSSCTRNTKGPKG